METIITPIPESASPPPVGNASMQFIYRDPDGAVLGHVCRYDGKEGKQIVPYTYHQDDTGNCSWRKKIWQEPRPLYGLDRLAQYPDTPVIICEGEKATDAAQQLFPDHPCITTSGGSNAVHKSDLSPLTGRECIIWPDADIAGGKYAASLANRLCGIASSVKILPVAEGKNSGWDAADALAEGWDAGCSNTYLATAIAATSATGSNVSSSSDYPDITPLESDMDAPKPYPVEALPPIIKDAVCSYQEYGQQPIELVAVSALSNMSLVCQGHANVARDEHLVGPISLNFILTAESGERKTSADNAFSKAAHDWEMEKLLEMKDELAEKRAEIESYKAKKSGIQQRIVAEAKKGKADGDHAKELEQQLVVLEKHAPHMPIVPELFYEDATKESFTEQLAFGYPTAALFSDEGGVVVGSHSFGKDYATGTFAFLNRMWDGKPYKRHRVTQTTCTIKDRRLTCSIMLQLSVLRQLINGTGGQSRGTGFLARQLLACPESTMGTRLYKKPPANDTYLQAFHDRVTQLLNMPLPVEGEEMYLKPPVLSLSEAAHGLWVDYYNDVEQQLGKLGDMETIRDFAAKSAENAARIAANLHVFSGEAESSICEATMQQAIAIAYWHLCETKRIFTHIDTPVEMEHARLLLDWLLEKDMERTSSKEIAQYGPNRLRKKAARDEAIHTLLDHGYLIERSEGKATKYLLNPQVKEAL